MLKKLVNRLFHLAGITRHPFIRLYDGYGDSDEIILQGHALRMGPLPPRRFRKNILLNILSLVRLFIVAPFANATVRLEWNGEVLETRSEADGFFKFDWKPANPSTPGWHKARASLIAPVTGLVLSTAESNVFIPHSYQYNFISDIDDTFLISHSEKLIRRLLVLFTRNAISRQPFEGVVRHYNMLAHAGATGHETNPFFYVSSSEWNLYYYIRAFCGRHGLPRGILLLGQIKRARGLLKTGRGKHLTKFVRIARILKCYPQHKYVLLGDNSQRDPEIYASVVKDFPEKIFAVYIRNVTGKATAATEKHLQYIRDNNIHTCFFVHSEEAILHSIKIGLVKAINGRPV